MAVTKKTVLITGCSAGGIGDALAQAFHRAGCRVFATARNLAKIEHLKEMGMDVIALDVVDPVSLKTAADEVKAATGGKLDVLVNNSGIGYSMPVLDSDPAEIRKMFEVNIISLITTTQAFSSMLIEAKGTVVNIGSIAGVAPFAWQAGYNASKAAANVLSDTMRVELEPLGVKVVLVVTGAVRSNFFQSHTELSLPAGSHYLPVQQVIEETMSGKKFENNQIPAKGYADRVVKNILKSSPTPRHWLGGSSSLVWVVATFLPATIWDTLLAGDLGITALRKKLAAMNSGTVAPK